MTRAELARQIEERERRAESKAAVKRALDYAARKRAEERAKVEQWIGKEPPQAPVFIKRAGRPAKRYTYQGQSLSLSEWALKLGIDHRLLQSRIAKGWPIEEALTIPKKHSRPEVNRARAKRYTYGNHTLTLKEWSTITGIDSETIRRRLMDRWQIGEALTTPSRQHPEPIVFDFSKVSS